MHVQAQALGGCLESGAPQLNHELFGRDSVHTTIVGKSYAFGNGFSNEVRLLITWDQASMKPLVHVLSQGGDMEPLLTAADAARILGVVPATVRVMALTGRLKPIAVTERGVRLFRREDVERLATKRAATQIGSPWSDEKGARDVE